MGYTAEWPNLSPRELYFRILPILSGYQEQETLEVVKTVSYEDLTQDSEIDVNDLIITIQLKDIKTANLFDEFIFESYFAGSDEQPSEEEVTALVTGEDQAV